MSVEIQHAIAEVRKNWSNRDEWSESFLANTAPKLADEVERLTAENADLKWLAYQCPPNLPVHGGQTWRDWASQLEKTIADATKTDPDSDGIAVSVQKLRAMSAENAKMADSIQFLNELVEDIRNDAAEKCKAAVQALNDGEADRDRLDFLQMISSKKSIFRDILVKLIRSCNPEGYPTLKIGGIREEIDAVMEGTEWSNCFGS